MSFAIGNGGTADKIEAVTALGAGSAVQVDYHVTQIDKLAADTNPTTVKTVVTNGQIATATTTKITTDPASSHEALVKQINLTNTHATSSCTVALQHTVGAGTARKLTNVITLLAGESIQFNGDGTMFVFDATGGVKTSLAAALTRVALTSGSAATYTTPAGCRAIDVQCWGGGGAGGGGATAASSGAAGAGGGSGGFTRKLFSPPSATYTYTVGAGGTPGAAGNNAGGAGADTTFGTLTAKGGSGGAGSAAASTALTTLGAAGGVAGSGGDVNLPGNPGGFSRRFSASDLWTGGGGDSTLGGAANGRITQGTGDSAATNSASGGAGGAVISAGAAVAGGSGGAGLIIVTEYY